MKNDLMVIGEAVQLELKQAAVQLPENYSFENALKSAYLILRETVDRQKRPALEVCTPESVHYAIMDMATQGLNPAKMQCYFVVYGNKLQLQTSYFGDIAVAKRVRPEVADIRATCIYQGDEIEIEIQKGQRVIKKHVQTFESFASEEIVGVYALAVDKDERVLYSDFMTMNQVKQSWKQSARSNVVMESGNINKDTTHGKFPEEMVKKTIYHRICKKIIRTSDDSALIAANTRSDEEQPVAARVQKEIQQNANKKVIDFKPQPDAEFETEPQEAMATTAQARTIVQLEKQARRGKEQTMESISGFTGRAISRLGELTAIEANGYIDALNEEMKEAAAAEQSQEQEPPAWAK